jgi:hypothetical protein
LWAISSKALGKTPTKIDHCTIKFLFLAYTVNIRSQVVKADSCAGLACTPSYTGSYSSRHRPTATLPSLSLFSNAHALIKHFEPTETAPSVKLYDLTNLDTANPHVLDHPNRPPSP